MLFEDLEILLRADNVVAKTTCASTGRDEVTADDVLLQTLKEVDLALDCALVEDLGGLLEGRC